MWLPSVQTKESEKNHCLGTELWLKRFSDWLTDNKKQYDALQTSASLTFKWQNLPKHSVKVGVYYTMDSTRICWHQTRIEKFYLMLFTNLNTLKISNDYKNT